MVLTGISWSTPQRLSAAAVVCLPKPKWNINHSCNDWRSIGDSGRRPINVPLVDDEEVHISEQHNHEGKLRDELEKEIKPLAKIYRVACFYKNTQCHVHNRYNHWDFHLQAVHKVQIIFSHSPYWVQPKTINTLVTVSWYWLSSCSCFWIVTRSKHIQTNWQKIIVNPTTIKCKKSHQCEQVPVRQ